MSTPLPSGEPHRARQMAESLDAVVAGQTWHWIDPVVGAAKAAQVLRPAGLLAVFWHVFQPPAEVASAFSAVYRGVFSGYDPYARPLLDAYSRGLATTAEGIRAAGAFGEPEEWRFDWARSYTRDEWLEQLRTGGDTARFTPEQLDQVVDGIGKPSTGSAAASTSTSQPWRSPPSGPADARRTFCTESPGVSSTRSGRGSRRPVRRAPARGSSGSHRAARRTGSRR